MIQQNKLSKYLIYAIGEIILVVIGILIALQVNNWNEERLVQAELKKLIDDVDEYTESLSFNSNLYDLLENFDSISKIFAYEKNVDKRLQHMSSIEELFLNDYANFPYQPIKSDYFVGSSVTSLLQRKEDLPSKYWTLIYSLEGLVQSAKEFESVSDEMYDLSNKSYDYFVDNYSNLIATDSILRFQLFNQLASDSKFQLRMRQMHQLNRSVMRNLNQTMGSILELNSKIKYIDYDYDKEELVNLAQAFGYKPLKQLNCDASLDVESSDNFTQYILIANTSPDDLIIYTPSRPFKQRNMPSGRIGPVYIKKGERMQIKMGDECLEILECTGRNYLIY